MTEALKEALQEALKEALQEAGGRSVYLTPLTVLQVI